jgi:hypothetical protein
VKEAARCRHRELRSQGWPQVEPSFLAMACGCTWLIEEEHKHLETPLIRGPRRPASRSQPEMKCPAAATSTSPSH